MKIKDQVVIKNIFDKPSVSFENLLNLPCYVYRKNKEGIYMNYNDYGAINLGYTNGRAIAGKNDFEIFPKDIASIFQENDQLVMKEEKQFFVSEKGILKNNFSVNFSSYKMPLYNTNQMIIGIVGISFVRPAYDNNDSTTKSFSVSELAHVCNFCRQKTTFNSLTLSEKEKICVHYLSQGFTLKMIAQKLKISPKTVETYLERAKLKMNCHNKSQLISAFIKMKGYI